MKSVGEAALGRYIRKRCKKRCVSEIKRSYFARMKVHRRSGNRSRKLASKCRRIFYGSGLQDGMRGEILSGTRDRSAGSQQFCGRSWKRPASSARRSCPCRGAVLLPLQVRESGFSPRDEMESNGAEARMSHAERRRSPPRKKIGVQIGSCALTIPPNRNFVSAQSIAGITPTYRLVHNCAAEFEDHAYLFRLTEAKTNSEGTKAQDHDPVGRTDRIGQESNSILLRPAHLRAARAWVRTILVNAIGDGFDRLRYERQTLFASRHTGSVLNL